jgi:hypothetical protein
VSREAPAWGGPCRHFARRGLPCRRSCPRRALSRPFERGSLSGRRFGLDVNTAGALLTYCVAERRYGRASRRRVCRNDASGLTAVEIHKAVPLGAVPGEYYRADDVDRPPTHPRRQLRDRRWGIPFVEGAAWEIAKFRNVCVNPRNHSIAATEGPGSFQRALVTLARRRR